MSGPDKDVTTPSFDNLLLVMAVAFAAPFALGLFPRAKLPSVVVEIVAGIVIGPSGARLVEVDQAVHVVAVSEAFRIRYPLSPSA